MFLCAELNLSLSSSTVKFLHRSVNELIISCWGMSGLGGNYSTMEGAPGLVVAGSRGVCSKNSQETLQKTMENGCGLGCGIANTIMPLPKKCFRDPPLWKMQAYFHYKVSETDYHYGVLRSQEMQPDLEPDSSFLNFWSLPFLLLLNEMGGAVAC